MAKTRTISFSNHILIRFNLAEVFGLYSFRKLAEKFVYDFFLNLHGRHILILLFENCVEREIRYEREIGAVDEERVDVAGVEHKVEHLTCFLVA